MLLPWLSVHSFGYNFQWTDRIKINYKTFHWTFALFSTEIYDVHLPIFSALCPICCVPWASTPHTPRTSEAQAFSGSQLRHPAQLSIQTDRLSQSCAASGARKQQEGAWDEGMAEGWRGIRPTKGQSTNCFLKRISACKLKPVLSTFCF